MQAEKFSALVERAASIQAAYRVRNECDGHARWTAAEYMQRFVGDVGDLAKLIMTSRGNRALDNVDAKLGHEIADCLWSLIVIAQELGIDLEGEFLKTMDDLDTVLDEATR